MSSEGGAVTKCVLDSRFRDFKGQFAHSNLQNGEAIALIDWKNIRNL